MYLKSYVAFLAVSLFAINAFACSCRTPPLAELVPRTDNIFIGRVVATYEFESDVHVNYQLIETLKGNQNLVK